MAYEERNPSVLWNVDQTGVLTDAERHQARKNIGLTNASGETSEDKYWARKGKGGLATLDETHGKVETTQLYSEFAKVKVTNGESSTILEADEIQDTLEITAGSGIALVADDTNDKFTIHHTNDMGGPQYVKNAWSDSHFTIPNMYFDRNGHLAQSADQKIPAWTMRRIHPGVKGTGMSGIIFSLDDDNAPETCGMGIGHSNQIESGSFVFGVAESDGAIYGTNNAVISYDANGHITNPKGSGSETLLAWGYGFSWDSSTKTMSHTKFTNSDDYIGIDTANSTGGKLTFHGARYDDHGHVTGLYETTYTLPAQFSGWPLWGASAYIDSYISQGLYTLYVTPGTTGGPNGQSYFASGLKTNYITSNGASYVSLYIGSGLYIESDTASSTFGRVSLCAFGAYQKDNYSTPMVWKSYPDMPNGGGFVPAEPHLVIGNTATEYISGHANATDNTNTILQFNPGYWNTQKTNQDDNNRFYVKFAGDGGITVSSAANSSNRWLSTVTMAHTNSVTAGTIGSSSASTGGNTISIPYAKYDSNGHITSAGTHTHTIQFSASTTAGAGDSFALMDSSDSNKLIRSGITLGSDATKFLNNKGEWAVPAGSGDAEIFFAHATYDADNNMFSDCTSSSDISTAISDGKHVILCLAYYSNQHTDNIYMTSVGGYSGGGYNKYRFWGSVGDLMCEVTLGTYMGDSWDFYLIRSILPAPYDQTGYVFPATQDPDRMLQFKNELEHLITYNNIHPQLKFRDYHSAGTNFVYLRLSSVYTGVGNTYPTYTFDGAGYGGHSVYLEYNATTKAWELTPHS